MALKKGDTLNKKMVQASYAKDCSNYERWIKNLSLEIYYHAIVHQQIFLQDLDTAIPREYPCSHPRGSIDLFSFSALHLLIQ